VAYLKEQVHSKDRHCAAMKFPHFFITKFALGTQSIACDDAAESENHTGSTDDNLRPKTNAFLKDCGKEDKL